MSGDALKSLTIEPRLPDHRDLTYFSATLNLFSVLSLTSNHHRYAENVRKADK
jgi:hypothetical protein